MLHPQPTVGGFEWPRTERNVAQTRYSCQLKLLHRVCQLKIVDSRKRKIYVVFGNDNYLATYFPRVCNLICILTTRLSINLEL